MDTRYTTTDTGLTVIKDMPFDDMVTTLEGLRQMGDKFKWSQADFLAYAEDKLGEDFDQMLDQTNWSSHSVKKLIRTARGIPRHIRTIQTSIWNHYELVGFTEDKQREALDKLVSKEWTREDLRKWKREQKGDDKPVEKTISLNVRAFKVVDGILQVAFDAPLETYKIIQYQAVVIEQKPLERAG